jgi:hypothetical protein
MRLENCKLIEQTEDIDCFKVLYEVKGNFISKVFRMHKYLSPYRDDKYYIGRMKSIKKENFICIEPEIDTIETGAFHSYMNLKEAEKAAIFLNETLDKDRFKRAVIARCVIPKSSKYTFKGTFFGDDSYASQKIVIKDIIYVTSQKQYK